ncbi:Hint domain-containing protein [Komagataeibacter rhaeticus]|nr:Hint domain-containing protein [Komagataeibacter rhaeticus]
MVRHGLPDDEAGYPVRILKDAIADGVPCRDMLVTPEHSLFLGGGFVPVRMLVNGRSIFYDHAITAYDYHHIETERHSIIMADGVLTESYLDTGNRHIFHHRGLSSALAGAGPFMGGGCGGSAHRGAGCGGTLYRQLEARARETLHDIRVASPVLHHDAGLHLVADDGAVIRQMRENRGLPFS